MKILKLHFRNINSLLGEFGIDFGHPALAQAGIFTITGPTGAGKTTILDAVAYALYGQTPRQKDISHSSNEIMSRQAPDCEATVIFESNNRHYRVSSSQSRRKARATTKDPKPFAEPRRSLEVMGPDGNWHLLETLTQGVRQRVKELSGLSFENFKRCMMLPQGDFANFLKANDKDRSEVLSTITGTDVYLKIGEYVHQNISDLEQALSAYQEQDVLSDEERFALQTRLEEARQLLAGHRKEHRNLTALLTWLETVQQEKEAVQSAQKQWQDARQALSDFETDGRMMRMELGQRAAKVEAHERAYLLISRQHREAEENLTQLEKALQMLEPRLQEAERQDGAARHQLETEGASLRAQAQRIEQHLRPLESERDALSAETRRAHQVMESAQRALAQAELEAHQARQQHEQATEHVAQSRLLLQARGADSALPAALSGMEQAWQQCVAYLSLDSELAGTSTGELQPRITQLSEQVKQALDTASLEQRALRIAQLNERLRLESALTESTKQSDKIATIIGQARQLQAELPSLEEAQHREQQAQAAYDLISHQASIEEKLELLYQEFREGKRDCCPCCGATTCTKRQPLAGNALADADRRCRRARQESQQLALRHEQVRQTLQEAHARLQAEHQQQQSLQNSYQTLTRQLGITGDQRPDTAELLEQEETELLDLKTRQQELQTLQTILPALRTRDALIATIRPFSAVLPRTFSEAAACLDTLRTRSEQYTHAALNLQEALRQQEQTALLADARQQRCAEQRQALENAQHTHETLQQKLQALSEAIRREWGPCRASDRIAAINSRLDTLRLAANTAHEQLTTLQAEHKKQQGQRHQQQQQLHTLAHDLQKSIDTFRQALQEQQFDNQSAYLDAKSFISDSDHLNHQHAELQQTLTEKRTTAEIRMHRLAELQAAHTCDLTRQELQQRISACNSAAEKAEQQLQQLTGTLAIDDHQREANRQARQQAEPLRHKLESWRKLYATLGGTKDAFLRYAQIITFQQLVQLANRELAELNDRYTLIPDPRNPLQLSIIDSYQDDSPRSCSNLSGGESFIVSLALALGLSRMAGDTRIDTLFLDEGFGTLDEDTLENVLNCLQTLQQKGRLIGIITHVEQLKEYIPNGLTVIPTGREGYSTLAAHPAVTHRSTP